MQCDYYWLLRLVLLQTHISLDKSKRSVCRVQLVNIFEVLLIILLITKDIIFMEYVQE